MVLETGVLFQLGLGLVVGIINTFAFIICL